MKKLSIAFVLLGLLALAAGPFGLIAGSSAKTELEQMVNTNRLKLDRTSPNSRAIASELSAKIEIPSVLIPEAATPAEAAQLVVQAEDAARTSFHAAAKHAIARDEAGRDITVAEKAMITAYENDEQFGSSRMRTPAIGSLDENGGTTIVSTDTPLRIPPSGTGGAGTDSVRSTIAVSGLGTYTLDVEVQIDSLIHTFDGDLDMYLRGPTGVQIELSTDNGSSGDNMIRTRIDDEAGVSITTAVAPMTGSYRPEVALSAFDGFNPNGNWMLLIYDDASGDTGIVHAWRLQIATVDLALTHNFSLTAITSPLAGTYETGASVPVTGRFMNFGTTTESAPIRYRFNGGATVSETSLSLAQLGIDLHTFGTNITMPGTAGTYVLAVWSDLATDEDRTNDTLRVTVTVKTGINCASAILLTGARDSANYNNCGTVDTSPGQTCGASGQDMVFQMVVPAGYEGAIWQSSNTLDSRHSLAWGGSCPGTNLVGCVDDPDTRRYSWTNTTGLSQTLYFVVGGFSLTTACGDFVLQWSLSNCLPATPPYAENFDAVASPSLPSCWSYENSNSLAPVWEGFSTSPRSAPNSASILGSATGNDDWLFTKGIEMEGGRPYILAFWRRGASITVPESLEVKLGAGPASGAMTQTLLPIYTFLSTAYTRDTVLIPVQPSTGVYYIGFHSLTKRSAGRTYIDDLEVYPQGGCAAPSVVANDVSTIGSVTLVANASGGYGGPIVYQWYTGGSCANANLIAGATNSTYLTAVSGTFSVRVYRGDSTTCAACDVAVATVLPGDNCANPDILTPPAAGFSVVYGGSTTGATADCADTCESGYRSGGPDVFYSMTLAQCARISMSLTDSTGNSDMHLSVYEGFANCCGNAIICNDDKSHFPVPEWANISQQGTGSLTSYLAGELPAGTYLIRVGRFSTGSGSYLLTVYNNGPCGCAPLICGGGDVVETPENRFDPLFGTTDPDGGCIDTSPLFGSVLCAQTICGVGFNYQDKVTLDNCFRDTDWYNFTLTEQANATLTVTSGFRALIAIVDATNCASPITLAGDTANPCVPKAVTTLLNAGTYTVFVAPAFDTGNPFPTTYRAQLVCAPLCSPDTVTDLTIAYAAPDSMDLRWTADAAFTGTYTVYSYTSLDDFPTSWTPLQSGIVPVAPPALTTYRHQGSPVARRYYAVVGVCPGASPNLTALPAGDLPAAATRK